jgi:hypothetical protein
MQDTRALEERRSQARERVGARRGLYIHAIVTAFVTTVLILIDAVTGEPWWFFWPLIGLGIGLAIHAIGVYGRQPFGADWEQRKVDQLLHHGGDR